MASASNPLAFVETSVPGIVFTPEGIITPAELDVLSGALIDIDTDFGGGMNTQVSTPQGQMASSWTAIIAAKNGDFAYFLNMIDPQFSTGRFQDAIGRIWFINRKGAEPTTVTCIVSGSAGTVLPAGTLAKDTSGNVYILLGDVTIGVSTTATSTWSNIVNGAIPCPAGTLTTVYQSVPGWGTITNPDDGALGRSQETPSEFEYRRKNSVAKNAQGTAEAVYANVFEVDGVLDCYVYNNIKPYSVTIGSTSYTVVRNSLYVAVLGGLDTDIANALWERKNDGSSLNGNTTVIVEDSSGYSYPAPRYEMQFNRPDPLSVKFQVQIANSVGLPSNIVQQVQTAMLARFNGTDGTSRERIGSFILTSRYYGAVAAINSSVQVLNIQVGTTIANLPTLEIGVDQYPTLAQSDISVVLV